MISLTDDLPDDPVLLKRLLLEALSRQEESASSYLTHIVDLKEQIKLLRDPLFESKSEQTVEPNTSQLALLNESESEPMPLVGEADEYVAVPTPRCGKRKPFSVELPRIEVTMSYPNTSRPVAAANMPMARKPASSWISCQCRFASSNISAITTLAEAAKLHRSPPTTGPFDQKKHGQL